MNDNDDGLCQAGRLASFRGRWLLPCFELATNSLAFSNDVGGPRAEGSPVLRFCHRHMGELIAAGIIDEPTMDPNEWTKRAGGPP